MVKNNILIGFHNKKICLSVSNVLKKYGIVPSYVCQSASNLRKMATYFGEGVIILGEKFSDEFSNDIINDLWQNFNIILIGSFDKINIYDDKKVYKLVTPLKQEELILALEMQLYKDTPKMIEKSKDEIFILKAKNILFEKYKFSEEEAYKYIQKKSMTERKKMIEIAKIIIENKGEIL